METSLYLNLTFFYGCDFLLIELLFILYGVMLLYVYKFYTVWILRKEKKYEILEMLLYENLFKILLYTITVLGNKTAKIIVAPLDWQLNIWLAVIIRFFLNIWGLSVK